MKYKQFVLLHYPNAYCSWTLCIIESKARVDNIISDTWSCEDDAWKDAAQRIKNTKENIVKQITGYLRATIYEIMKANHNIMSRK